MEPLYKYLGKRVKVITKCGNEWHGLGYVYLDEDENEGEESMAFRMDGFKRGLIELHPSEIESIEVEEKKLGAK